MTNLSDYGSLTLGSRLRRLSDQLYTGVDASYRAAGIDLPSRCLPLLFLLRDNGPTAITVLAAQIGQTHPVVVQLGNKLLAAGLVSTGADASDERRRLLALSAQGHTLLIRMAPLWKDVMAAVDSATDNGTGAFLAMLDRIETALHTTPFSERIAARRRAREMAQVELIDFAPRYAADFKRLNIEWLERYFYVEALDDQVLSDPQRSILEQGGAIFLALLDGQVVGTCALLRPDAERFELSKMAVTAPCQGLGVGRRLIERALARFEASGARLLFLESNSKLTPALALYQSVGFVHATPPAGGTHYHRANVYMEWRGSKAPAPV
ncbi:MAG: helix-turn-helix domain-containing GNAT family N-acetyltransferase [Pseudomonadota bacterium]